MQRRKFSREFTVEAVKLIKDRGVSSRLQHGIDSVRCREASPGHRDQRLARPCMDQALSRCQ